MMRKTDARAKLAECSRQMAEAMEAVRIRSLALERAQQELRDAHEVCRLKRDKQREAQEAADEFEPQATIRITTRSSETLAAAVIVSRTAKTIKVRHVGSIASQEIQFREKAGQWCEYPAPKGYGHLRRTLVLPKEAGK